MRRAAHAGSWYSQKAGELGTEFDSYLAHVDPCVPGRRLKALVSPHAGYTYSGSTAAWGFGTIDSALVRTVFVLGPSHHVHLNRCALPGPNIHSYNTPFGPIGLDATILNDLRKSQKFSEFSPQDDEQEHSVEMQLPFLKYVMGNQAFTIVPIVVGSTSPRMDAEYGSLLAPYFEQPETLFIISSDFCHWGARFGYQHLLREQSVVLPNLPPIVYPMDEFPVNGGIEALDRQGMRYIVEQDIDGFQTYLSRLQNTICGRHPICVFLEVLRCVPELGCKVHFVHYSQSHEISARPRRSESCVAYASGLCTVAA
jgi:AmmeMemoRadiSam system protein B